MTANRMYGNLPRFCHAFSRLLMDSRFASWLQEPVDNWKMLVILLLIWITDGCLEQKSRWICMVARQAWKIKVQYSKLLLILLHNFLKEWKLAGPLSIQFPFEVLKDSVKALTSHLTGYCHQYLSMILEILIQSSLTGNRTKGVTF